MDDDEIIAIGNILQSLIKPFAETLSRNPPETVKIWVAESQRNRPEVCYLEMTLRCDEGDLNLRISSDSGNLSYRIKTEGSLELDEREWSLSDPECISKARTALHQFTIYWYYNVIKSMECRIELAIEQIRNFQDKIDEGDEDEST